MGNQKIENENISLDSLTPTLTDDTGEEQGNLLPSKFKSVDSLLKAYTELEAEFTRKSQKIKTLEEQLNNLSAVQSADAVNIEGIKTQAVKDYLKTLGAQSVPNVIANTSSTFNTVPAVKPTTMADVKSAVLAFFENKKN